MAVVVVAGAVGIGGGYALGRHDRPRASLPPHPQTAASAAPIPAIPQLSIAQSLPYHADIEYPTLPVGLSYVRARVHAAGHTWSYPRPAGWKKYPAGKQDPAGTVRWRPSGEQPEVNGYVLRVLPIPPRDTPKDMVEHQTEKMNRYYRDVTVHKTTDDTVWFIYRSNDNYRRYNYFTWVRTTGSPYAGFEISVAGRIADAEGLADLIGKVRAGARMME